MFKNMESITKYINDDNKMQVINVSRPIIDNLLNKSYKHDQTQLVWNMMTKLLSNAIKQTNKPTADKRHVSQDILQIFGNTRKGRYIFGSILMTFIIKHEHERLYRASYMDPPNITMLILAECILALNYLHKLEIKEFKLAKLQDPNAFMIFRFSIMISIINSKYYIIANNARQYRSWYLYCKNKWLPTTPYNHCSCILYSDDCHDFWFNSILNTTSKPIPRNINTYIFTKKYLSKVKKTPFNSNTFITKKSIFTKKYLSKVKKTPFNSNTFITKKLYR
jgi:hypothetical protein